MSQTAEENPIDDMEIPSKTNAEVKPSKDRKNRKEKIKPLAKVIIRRLPPTMTEDEFLKQIEPIPEHDYFYFVPADWSLGPNATCRAYINFCNQNDIFIFKDKFDGYVFVDGKGADFPAIVEFAPFQGLPKSKSRKKDLKANTIDSEPHYLAFLESLKEDESEGKTETKMEYSFQLKDDQKITSTPLLEYIANVKQERRDERKRKIEDRKRQREEEKQRKKSHIAKSIPKSIEEETKENDDGIVVRTIKSRPLDRERNRKDRNVEMKPDKDKGNNKLDATVEKRRAEREKRDAVRREEQLKSRERRNAKRKEERERNKKEREERQSGGNKDDDSQATKTVPMKEEKEKVKKYSESRRERRERAEQQKANVSDAPPKSSSQTEPSTKRGDAFKDNNNGKPLSNNNERKTSEVRDYQSQNSLDDNQSNSSGENINSKSNRDRSIRNIRNKDRPSLQIYQPGKRRSSTTSAPSTSDLTLESNTKTDETEIPTKFISNSIQNDQQTHENNVKDKSAIKNTERRSSQTEKLETKKLSVEKKVIRYSEKRKAKEKRVSATIDDNIQSNNLESNESKKNVDENIGHNAVHDNNQKIGDAVAADNSENV